MDTPEERLRMIQDTPFWKGADPEVKDRLTREFLEKYGGQMNEKRLKPFSIDPSTFDEQTRGQLLSLAEDASLDDHTRQLAIGAYTARTLKPWQRVAAGVGWIFDALEGGIEGLFDEEAAVQNSRDQAYAVPLLQTREGAAGAMAAQGLMGSAIPGGAGTANLAKKAAMTGAEALVSGGTEALRATDRKESKLVNTLVGTLSPVAISALQGFGAKTWNSLMDNQHEFNSPFRFKEAPTERAELINLGKKYDVPVGFADLPGQGQWKPWSRIAERIPIVGSRNWRIGQAEASERAARGYAEALLPAGTSFDMPAADMQNELLHSVKKLYDRRMTIAENLYQRISDFAAILPKKERIMKTNLTNEAMSKVLKEFPNAFNELNAATSTRNKFASILQRTEIPIFDANGTRITYNVPITIKEAIELDKEIGALRRAAKGPKNKNTARLLGNVQDALREDMGNWVTDITSNEAHVPQTKVQLKEAWDNAREFFRTKVAPIDNNEALWRIITDDFDPARAVREWIQKDAPQSYVAAPGAKRAGILDAMDLHGRQLLKGNIINEVIKGSHNGGIFMPGKFATNLEKQLGSSLEGLLSPSEQMELSGLAKLMKHVDMAGNVAGSKGGELGGFFTGIPGGVGLSAAMQGWKGLKNTGTAVILTLGATRLLTSETGRKILTASWKLKPGSEAMDKLMTRANQFLIGAASRGVIQRLNNNDYVDKLMDPDQVFIDFNPEEEMEP